MGRSLDRRAFLLSSLLASMNLSHAKAMEKLPRRKKGKVLVAGGSGQTGLHIMRILDENRYTPLGLTTNVARAQSKVPDKEYDWLAVDVRDVATMLNVFKGVDYVICALGSGRSTRAGITPETIDYGGVKNVVDLAVQNEIKHFVLISSAGATISDPEHYFNRLSGNSFIWKFKGEEHLRVSGLTYTIIRPGNLNLKDKDYEPGTRGIVFDQGDRIFGADNALIHRVDLAEVCVAALADSNSRNKTFEVYADQNSPLNAWRESGFRELKPDT